MRELTIYFRNGTTARFKNVTIRPNSPWLTLGYESASRPGTFVSAQFFPKQIAGFSLDDVTSTEKP